MPRLVELFGGAAPECAVAFRWCGWDVHTFDWNATRPIDISKHDDQQGLLGLSPLVWFSSMPSNATELTDFRLDAKRDQDYVVGAKRSLGSNRRSPRG